MLQPQAMPCTASTSFKRQNRREPNTEPNSTSHLVPHPPSDLERELLSLPTSLGGLGICDLNYSSGANYKFSHELSRPLVDLILCQQDSLPHDVIDAQCLVFKQLSQAKHQCQVDTAKSILSRSLPTLRRAIECCQEKGASSWLSALPIERYGFALHWGEPERAPH